MNILLAGATSFLGLAVCRALLDRGDAVYAPVRADSARRSLLPVHPALHPFPGDLRDAGAIRRADLPEMEVCVDFAWSGVGVRGRMDPAIQAENVKNTLSFLREAHALGCRRFLFSGSQAEYGVTEERVRSGVSASSPVTEDAPCRPLSEYGKGKLTVLREGAELSRKLGMEYVHMRIFSVYGPGDHETSLVSTCVHAVRTGTRTSLGPCSQLWNFLYVEDLAAAVLALTDAASVSGGQRIYNVGSLDTRPLKDFVRDIFSVSGDAAPREHSAPFERTAPRESFKSPEDSALRERSAPPVSGALYEFCTRPAGPEGTPYLSPDISRLMRDTGFQPAVSFPEGIRRILAAKTAEV